jgi:hypothetical protein
MAAAAVSPAANHEKTVIEVMDSGVEVRRLLIPRADIADYLRPIPEEDRIGAFINAVEVGVFCLERSRAGADMDFVRRQVDALLERVQQTVGMVPSTLEKRLVERIGTADGQVLAPVQTLVKGMFDLADGKVAEIRELFAREIDPGKDSSTLGIALRALRDLLDPKRKDSIQASFENALQAVTARDGVLTSAVRDVVGEALKPLKQEIDDLSKEIQQQRGEEVVIDRTTEKGTPFQEEIVARLQLWAELAGAEI